MSKEPRQTLPEHPPQGRCTTCALIEFPFDLQSGIKRERLAQLFSEEIFGPYEFAPTFVPQTILPSRSRARFAVGGSRTEPLIGFPRSDGSVVDHADCPLHLPPINQIAGYIRELIPRYKIDPYDVVSGRGEFKGFTVRVNHDCSEAILRFVFRSTEPITRLKKALPEITAAFPQIRVVSVNIQPINAALPEGPEEHLLSKKLTITEKYCGMPFIAGPQSFSQVTHQTADELYRRAAQAIAESGAETMLDLFCGIGVFSLTAASHLKHGAGVEISPHSIVCAESSAAINKIKHLSFSAADAGAYMKTVSPGSFDTILCNPPRRGCGAGLVDSILKAAPRTVIFSSCGPEGLAADLRGLSAKYHLKSLTPFEMFPFTEHIEVLAVLNRTGAE